MTLRLIARIEDASMMVNVGGEISITYRTFEIDYPELEAILADSKKTPYFQAHLVAAEIVKPA